MVLEEGGSTTEKALATSPESGANLTSNTPHNLTTNTAGAVTAAATQDDNGHQNLSATNYHNWVASYDQLRRSLDGSLNASFASDAAGTAKGAKGDDDPVLAGHLRSSGNADILRKNLQARGITVSSADQLLADQQQSNYATSSEGGRGEDQGANIMSSSPSVPAQNGAAAAAVFTSTPTSQQLELMATSDFVTKDQLTQILKAINSANLMNSAVNQHQGGASAGDVAVIGDSRSRAPQRGMRPTRSESPAIINRHLRSQSTETMNHLNPRGIPTGYNNMRTSSTKPNAPSGAMPPLANAVDVANLTDEEVIRRSAERGLHNVPESSLHRLQLEINQVKTLHQAKERRLEDKVEFLEQQLQMAQTYINTATAAQNKADPMVLGGGSVGGFNVLPSSKNNKTGLCIKCAKHDVVVTTTQSSIYMQKIDKLTQDLGEAEERIESYKKQLFAFKQRELESYNQIRNSVQLVEQAQLERTQAVVESQQLREEVQRAQKRLQDSHLDAKHRVAAERDSVRAECKREMDLLSSKMDQMTEEEASLRVALEKSQRGYNELKRHLEKAKLEVEESYMNVNKVSESLKAEMAAAVVERDDMKQELESSKRGNREQLREYQQELGILRSEIEELRRRLGVSEKSENNSREQLVSLTEYVGKLEREAYQSKRSLDQMNTHMRSSLEKAKDREANIQLAMKQQKQKFDMMSKDMEDLMASQNSLICKLKTECKFLLDQLQTLTFKYQSDVENLEVANEELSKGLKHRHKQVKHFEREAVKHGRMHQRMKHEIDKMASASHTAQNEINHLVIKQNSLLKERDAMAQEIHFFRSEALGAPGGGGRGTTAADYLLGAPNLHLLNSPMHPAPSPHEIPLFHMPPAASFPETGLHLDNQIEELLIADTEREIPDNIFIAGEEKLQS